LHPTYVLSLPRIKVQDHLGITIDAIELDQQQYSRTSKLLELINNTIQKIPIPRLDSATSAINNLAGTILNLVSALDDDDIMMREMSTHIIDKITYGDNFPSEKYLKTELLFFGGKTRRQE
jgi:hypothetical protein